VDSENTIAQADGSEVIDTRARIAMGVAVKNILRSIGEDEYREGLKDTPLRVARMYQELTSGYNLNGRDVLTATFEDDTIQDYDGMVIVKDIQYYSLCEHHMVPFFGNVHIGYIPNGKVVGLSKLARLVDVYARRLQVQERMTKQIAETIEEVLEPLGVIVIVEGTHLCMTMRGAKSPTANTTTSTVKGIFQTDAAARAEFLSLIGRK
jgi:GTP cyclohydrolase I